MGWRLYDGKRSTPGECLLLGFLLVAPLLLSTFVWLPGIVLFSAVQPYGSRPEWVFWASIAYRSGGSGYGVYPAQAFTSALVPVLGTVLLLQVASARLWPATTSRTRRRRVLGRAALVLGTCAVVARRGLMRLPPWQDGWTELEPPLSVMLAAAFLAVAVAGLAFRASARGPSSGILALVLGEQLAEAAHLVFQWIADGAIHTHALDFQPVDLLVVIVPTVLVLRRLDVGDEKLGSSGLACLLSRADLAVVPWSLAKLAVLAYWLLFFYLPFVTRSPDLLLPRGTLAMLQRLDQPMFTVSVVSFLAGLVLVVALLRRPPEDESIARG